MLRLLLSLTLLLPTWVGAQPTQTPADLDAEAWRADLRYLVDELELRHADLYHTIDEEAFREAVAELDARIPHLDDDEVVVEVARLTARVGDGHTGLLLPFDGFDFRRLPLELYDGPGGHFVLAASPEHRDLVGTRLVRVGMAEVEDLVGQILPLVPRDNDAGLRTLAAFYLRLAELLETLGAVEDPDAVPLTVEDADGQRRTVIVRPLDRRAEVDWQYIRPRTELPLYLRQRDTTYWFEYFPESRTVFLQFNSADIGAGAEADAFRAFTDSLVTFVDENEADRLVIDLRWNAGGSIDRARYVLAAALRADRLNRPGALFTVTGPTTFSAASVLAKELDEYTETLFVGEPMAGRPSGGFGDLGFITLPNSGVRVRYSRWGSHPRGDHRPTIVPDLHAPLTLEAYRVGVDPALEAILAMGPRPPIGEVVDQTIREDGLGAAIEEYRRLRRTAYNSYDFGIAELYRLGHRLLQDGDVEEAVALFELNLEHHPYHPFLWDALGDGYRAAGRREEAVESYLRAFAIDKQLSQSLDKARELQRELGSDSD